MADEYTCSVLKDGCLDFLSDNFDPLRALYTKHLQPPVPNIQVFNNLAEYARIIKEKKTNTRPHVIPARKIVEPSRRTRNLKPEYQPCDISTRLKAIADGKIQGGVVSKDDVEASVSGVKPLLAGKQIGTTLGLGTPWKKKYKNVIERMEECVSGPFSILYKCLKERYKVQVWIRKYKGLRSVLTGYVIAFDKHMNLALMDVDELYTVEELQKDDNSAETETRKKKKKKKKKKTRSDTKDIDVSPMDVTQDKENTPSLFASTKQELQKENTYDDACSHTDSVSFLKLLSSSSGSNSIASNFTSKQTSEIPSRCIEKKTKGFKIEEIEELPVSSESFESKHSTQLSTNTNNNNEMDICTLQEHHHIAHEESLNSHLTEEYKTFSQRTEMQDQSLPSPDSTDGFQLDSEKPSYLFSQDLTVRVPAHDDDVSRDVEFTLVGIFQPKPTEQRVSEDQDKVRLPDDIEFQVPLSFPHLITDIASTRSSLALQQEVSNADEKEPGNLSKSSTEESSFGQQKDQIGPRSQICIEGSSSMTNLRKLPIEDNNCSVFVRQNEGEEMEKHDKVGLTVLNPCHQETSGHHITWQPPLSFRCGSVVQEEGLGPMDNSNELAEACKSVAECELTQSQSLTTELATTSHEVSVIVSKEIEMAVKDIDNNSYSTETNLLSVDVGVNSIVQDQPDSDDISTDQADDIVENIPQTDNSPLKTSSEIHSKMMDQSPDSIITMDIEDERLLVEQPEFKVEDITENILSADNSSLETNTQISMITVDIEDDRLLVEQTEFKEEDITENIVPTDNSSSLEIQSPDSMITMDIEDDRLLVEQPEFKVEDITENIVPTDNSSSLEIQSPDSMITMDIEDDRLLVEQPEFKVEDIIENIVPTDNSSLETNTQIQSPARKITVDIEDDRLLVEQPEFKVEDITENILLTDNSSFESNMKDQGIHSLLIEYSEDTTVTTDTDKTSILEESGSLVGQDQRCMSEDDLEEKQLTLGIALETNENNDKGINELKFESETSTKKVEEEVMSERREEDHAINEDNESSVETEVKLDVEKESEIGLYEKEERIKLEVKEKGEVEQEQDDNLINEDEQNAKTGEEVELQKEQEIGINVGKERQKVKVDGEGKLQLELEDNLINEDDEQNAKTGEEVELGKQQEIGINVEEERQKVKVDGEGKLQLELEDNLINEDDEQNAKTGEEVELGKQQEIGINVEEVRQKVKNDGEGKLQLQLEDSVRTEDNDPCKNAGKDLGKDKDNSVEESAKMKADVKEEQQTKKDDARIENTGICYEHDTTTVEGKVESGKGVLEESKEAKVAVFELKEEKVENVDSEKEEGEITSSDEEDEFSQSKDTATNSQQSKTRSNLETRKSVWDRLGNKGASTKTARKTKVDEREKTSRERSRQRPLNYEGPGSEERTKGDTVSKGRRSSRDIRSKDATRIECRDRGSEKRRDSSERKNQSSRKVKEERNEVEMLKKKSTKEEKESTHAHRERSGSLESTNQKRTSKEKAIDTKKSERKDITKEEERKERVHSPTGRKDVSKRNKNEKDKIVEEGINATDAREKERKKGEDNTARIRRRKSCSLKSLNQPDDIEKTSNVSKTERHKIESRTENSNKRKEDDTVPGRRSSSLKSLREPADQEKTNNVSGTERKKIDSRSENEKRKEVNIAPRRSSSLKSLKEPDKEWTSNVSGTERKKIKSRAEKGEKIKECDHVQRISSSKAPKEHKAVYDKSSKDASKTDQKIRSIPFQESKQAKEIGDTRSTSKKVDSDRSESEGRRVIQERPSSLKQRMEDKTPISKEQAERSRKGRLKTDLNSGSGITREKQSREMRKETEKISHKIPSGREVGSNENSANSKSHSKVERKCKTKLNTDKREGKTETEDNKNAETDTDRRKRGKTDMELKVHLKTETQESHNERSDNLKQLTGDAARDEKDANMDTEVKKVPKTTPKGELLPTPETTLKVGLLPTPVASSSASYTAIRESLQRHRMESPTFHPKRRVATLNTSRIKEGASGKSSNRSQKDIRTNKRGAPKGTTQKESTFKIQTKKRKLTQENMTEGKTKRQKITTDSRPSDKCLGSITPKTAEYSVNSELTSKNVDEQKNKESVPVCDDIPAVDARTGYTIRSMEVGKGKLLTFKRRHVNQLFIRGDNVVMVAYAT